jgi:hypothetical protein
MLLTRIATPRYVTISTIFMMGLLLSVPSRAVAQGTTIALPMSGGSEPVPISPDPLKLVEIRALDFVAEKKALPRESLRVDFITLATWSDGCLGLGEPDEICTQATVKGWRVEASAGKQKFVIRTDEVAQVLRLESSTTVAPGLSIAASQLLLSTASKQLGIPSEELSIGSVKDASFDGCLGIYVPNRACIQIAISGYKAVVKSKQRGWVYHLDRDARQIVMNRTASYTRGELFPTFALLDSSNSLDKGVVFQTESSSDVIGRSIKRTLSEDGTITEYVSGPTIKTQPVVIRRISKRAVRVFLMFLEHARFPNFNGISYINLKIADVPSILVKSMGTSTVYTPIDEGNLPSSLRFVLRSWKMLLSPAQFQKRR